jgi:hypothetical protein
VQPSAAVTFKIPFASISKVTSLSRNTTGHRRNTLQLELAKRVVVLRHRTLTLKDLDQHTRLVLRIGTEPSGTPS